LPIKLGLNIVWMKPELQVRTAQLAEDLGFEGAWSGEHLALPKGDPDWWRKYPRVIQLGEAATPDTVNFTPDSPFLDPLIILATIAGATKKIRLGVGIYMLPLRDAVLVAKMVASLDVLSGGRLDLGVGLGWSEDEYSFTGNDFSKRGRKMDETIRAMRECFEKDTPEFHGEFYDFGPMGFAPKPVQTPLPILIGGGTPAAEKRAGYLGNGWHGSPESIPRVKAHLAAAGREGEPFQFSSITLGPASRADLEEMAAQGVYRAVVTPWTATKLGVIGEEGLTQLESYAKEIGLV
ncbi:MAG: family F420-dependent class oxidoreductase, partial [Phenylobacterium sp.]|nr:family F420-dependent class oxidoreductase [Phenylobacterium sp.]